MQDIAVISKENLLELVKEAVREVLEARGQVNHIEHKV